MKMVDIDYHVSLYNTANEVPDNIAKLHFPQRYIRLVDPSGQMYELEIADINGDEIILCLGEKSS